MITSARRVEEAVAGLGERYGLRINPRARVADLSVGEQQRVEIVKMLYRGVDVLILDEPTAVLTPRETQNLFETARAMAADGKAEIFISHKLAEVTAVCDSVTVMSDGRVVERVKTSSTNRRELARMMVGRDVDLSGRRSKSPPGPVLLALESVDLAGGEQDAISLQEINLEVRAGEIVGIAGVAGNGQRELAEVVAGLRAPSSGTVRIDGKEVTGAGASAARRAGLAYVPEDRLGTPCPTTGRATDRKSTRL